MEEVAQATDDRPTTDGTMTNELTTVTEATTTKDVIKTVVSATAATTDETRESVEAGETRRDETEHVTKAKVDATSADDETTGGRNAKATQEVDVVNLSWQQTNPAMQIDATGWEELRYAPQMICETILQVSSMEEEMIAENPLPQRKARGKAKKLESDYEVEGEEEGEAEDERPMSLSSDTDTGYRLRSRRKRGRELESEKESEAENKRMAVEMKGEKKKRVLKAARVKKETDEEKKEEREEIRVEEELYEVPKGIARPELCAMDVARIGGYMKELIDELEGIRTKSKKLQGRLSGHMKDNLTRMKEGVSLLVTRANAVGDPQYLRMRVGDLEIKLKDKERENSRLKEEMRKTSPGVKSPPRKERPKDLCTLVLLTQMKRKVQLPFHGEQQ